MKERMKQEIKSKLGDVCIAGDAFAKEMHRLFNVIAAVLMEDETLFTNHCGQDAHRQANDDDAKKLEQLVGARVRLFHAPGHKCSECPYRIKSDGSTCNYFKVETASGYYLCLAWSQQDERPVISFDEGTVQEDTPTNIMDIIGEETKKFLDFLDGVVKSQE